MIEQLAVVAYGLLTILVAIALAAMQHSTAGMALAFLAAGVTYVFQFIQLLDRIPDRVLWALVIASIILTVASAAVSTFGG